MADELVFMGIADSIAGAIGACVLNRKNVRAEPGDENASLDHRFSAPSVDGRKRCENASVDAELFIRFRGTKNGGFQKCISVDRALIDWHLTGSSLLLAIL